MYDSGSALVARLRAAASVAQIRLDTREAAERRRDGEADHPEGVTVQRDRLAETQVRRLGKGALDHHAPGSDPRPGGHLGLVDRGHARLTSFDLALRYRGPCCASRTPTGPVSPTIG